MSDETPPAPKRAGERGVVRALQPGKRRVEDAIAFVNELASDEGLRGIVVVALYEDADRSTVLDSFGATNRADLAFAGALLSREATE